MSENTSSAGGRPDYDRFTDMREVRGPLGNAFARNVLDTARPWLRKSEAMLDVLDIGSGYGHTAVALALTCRSVVGMEPAAELHDQALRLAASSGVQNLTFQQAGVEALDAVEAFDLIVLDNVYEHLRNQNQALAAISRALRPGGVLYLLVPNKLWPLEAHYKLPFLSWLPLPLANRYLRVCRLGEDYTDASYAPTWWGLRRQLRRHDDLSWHFVLPAHRTATVAGAPLHYRIGMNLLERYPALWAVSKALLVIAVKRT